MKISCILTLIDEEGITLSLVLKCRAINNPILHRPELGISTPALEILTIKDRLFGLKFI